MELLQGYHALGCRCIILTARTEGDIILKKISKFLCDHGVRNCVSDIVFTNHQLKGPFAVEHKVKMHYDDEEKHLNSIREHGITAIATQ